jgi:hypothetical protein
MFILFYFFYLSFFFNFEKKMTNKNLCVYIVLMYTIFVNVTKLTAEGTPQVSPNSTAITALGILPNGSRGSYLNAPDFQRVYFRVTNHTRENLYFGFRWVNYSNGNNITDMYYRILDPSGNVVLGPVNYTNSGYGYINTYSEAIAGPNLWGATPSGYRPAKLDPTANGDYWIEYWRGTSTTMTTSSWATAPLFDFTLRDTVNNVNLNGRVFSQKWAMVAVDTTNFSNANAHLHNSEADFFGYTDDSTVLRLNFQTGFRPIAFDVAITKYGVSNSGNPATDRNSRNDASSPSLADGYKVFLRLPDTSVFKISTVPTNAVLNNPPILNCSAPYLIRYRTFQTGDVKIFLDINGTAGYQRGTTDRIIEIFDVTAGNNQYTWDGLDGLGNAVSNTTNISLNVTLLRGRFNLPLFDAEINKNGMIVSGILPVSTPSLRLFWNDTNLVNVNSTCGGSGDNQNNITGFGINNSLVGSIGPAHAWSGDGNISQTIPAAAVGSNETSNLQCDDFGNVRTINTWGWIASATASTGARVGCLTVSGTIWNDVNGSAAGTNSNIFTSGEVGTTAGTTIYATLIDPLTGFVLESVLVNSTNGTYSFSNVPKNSSGLPIRLTSTQGTVGSSAPAIISLPSGWVNTSPLTQNINTANVNITGIDYGIQELPTPSSTTESSRINPGGTTSSSVSSTSFSATDPSSGSINSIRITSFPSNATSITINGTTYTSGTFPGAGVSIPTNSSGNPTQAILVDPINGAVTVAISYRATDNAGFESTASGTVSIPFSAVSVSGTVFRDGNGLTDATINGTGTNVSSSLFANLIDGSGNVRAVGTVSGSGTYSISNVDAGNYTIVLSTTSGTVGNPAPAATLPSGYVNTGEGTATAGDGTINGITSITVVSSNVTGINYGINSLATADIKSYSLSTAFNINDEITLNGTGSDPGPLTGNDSEDGSKGSGDRVIIYAPNENNLYYDINGDGVTDLGELITDSVIITNYNPSRLIVRFTVNNSIGLNFNYRFVDQASFMGSIANYSISLLIPLDVTLIDFYAKKDNKYSNIFWSTSSETNSSLFEIERSEDLIHWYKIGTVSSVKNSFSITRYSFKDNNPIVGINHYRLKMIDQTNSYQYSKIIFLDFQYQLVNILVHPNPTSDILKLTSSEPLGLIEIINVYGQTIVSKETTEETLLLDIKHLPSGVYTIRTSTNNFKVIKQ